MWRDWLRCIRRWAKRSTRSIAVGVHDVEVDGVELGGWIGGAVEQGGFEHRDAVETPGGVGEFPGELPLGGRVGLIFIVEFAAVALVGGGVRWRGGRGAVGALARAGG